MPVLWAGHPADGGGRYGRAPLDWCAIVPGLRHLRAAIMGVRYETRAERGIRIGQWIATVLVLVIVTAGIVAGLWGLGIPDPSTARP